jgi:hypothetical protein
MLKREYIAVVAPLKSSRELKSMLIFGFTKLILKENSPKIR